MIPKIIHYCWFGGNPLPPIAIECIASWKKYLPEYEIKEWNERNFDVICEHKGFTESHQVVIDVSKIGGGTTIAEKLESANIILNKNT